MGFTRRCCGATGLALELLLRCELLPLLLPLLLLLLLLPLPLLVLLVWLLLSATTRPRGRRTTSLRSRRVR